ncbi:MAG: hotdog fold thioesterase [Sedimentisphaerales bacterium]|nr:hotdog fold thioesterase [Sedimentisphaerales bacterium]
MDQFSEFFAKDAFSHHCGIELVEAGGGRAITRMTIEQKHLNGVGVVHGGAIFALADAAFAAASNSEGRIAVAININISYLRGAVEGVLAARAVEINPDKKIGSYRVDVTDQEDQIVAVFEGLVYRKKQ